ncbi:penicillin acylase family protein [Thermoleophilum album]|uniref:Acyl-homoserine lactone (AHL) acylase PvdQ n=1 Tax=Thermoleophilum album TaxID=29539 RepID=A0A1H6FXB0_THEAL|nr:penicillin acylase family protein [Thermoleophilum album]SEH15052.1 Acyl-homoserine lactone (AHL) acylase PvdQ [Thermoleophilum album]
MRKIRNTRLRLCVALGCALVAAFAAAGVPARAADPAPYRANDGGGFRNILPPGQNGVAPAPALAQFLLACPPNGPQGCPNAPRPPHYDDQLAMYGDLVYAVPGLTAGQLDRFFKDASFGVPAGEAERIYSPRPDVTIVRDRRFGVPRVYGRTREAALFGLGYVAAEDRLFVMDVLRHAGRAQLSSFVGGSLGNRELDREQWRIAPYTEADLERQFELGDDLYGDAGRRLQEDARAYVAGINAYIDEARLDPARKLPAEYLAIGRPLGPDPWKVTDLIATASLIGGIFGKGGGGELQSALLLQEAQRRFGNRRGRAVWHDLREADDPEAPVTVEGRRFPYQTEPRKLAPDSLALPDPGSVRFVDVVAGESGSSGSQPPGPPSLPGLPLSTPKAGRGDVGSRLLDLLRRQRPGSNALLVSARESESGRPLAVMGPQTAYFVPNLLHEIEVHGPGLEARGAAFAGVGLYVLLGRGRDYAWSATSAGQDIIDTFALPLCEPDGSQPTLASDHYLYRGRCLPFEVLERHNSWTPNLADQTPAGSETLRTLRTKLGLVIARATIGGRPVVYTQLRSTYFHEVDSALGFDALNDPGRIRSPRDFMAAVSKIGFTFNWFYIDHRHIAYFNSGNNPVRAPGVSPDLPTDGRFEWRDWNPELWTARYTPMREHPQVVDQAFLANWNNKQARGYRAADDNFAYGSIYRSDLLSDRIRALLAGRRKANLVELVSAMEDAGTVDLRGAKVLPYLLRVIGTPRDPELRRAVAILRSWVRSGAHRIDRNRDRIYEDAEAVRIMDAWWPRLLHAIFEPVLGERLFRQLEAIRDPDDEPNAAGQHRGSAYNGGWYHYVEKDLRTLLGRRGTRGLRPPPAAPARYSRTYCGGTASRGGTLGRCRDRLLDSLEAALAVPNAELYGNDPVCPRYGLAGDQWCFDAVWHRPFGAISEPLIHWINRPTFQQVVEVERPAPR